MGFSIKTLSEGDGQTYPKTGDKVKVHYVGTFLNGKVFDSSRDRCTPFTFEIGRGQVIRGWDEGITLMSVGEIAELTCTPDYAYGLRGYPPTIPSGSTLVFNIQLLGLN